MVEINVYDDIANKNDGVFMSSLGIEGSVFSAETVKNLFAKNRLEKEFKFNIHCNGGSVFEGLAIYDIIRNSGKTIYTNIEGACHSMAICLLLAAPKGNRTANRNARALIHPVQAHPQGQFDVDQLRELADEVEKEQNSILDIYQDRTGCNREILKQLMKSEKQYTANELLEYGFISKINNYSTNKNVNTMSKKNQKPNVLLNRAANFLNRLGNLLADTQLSNFMFVDEEGNELFSTESENDTLEVGTPASPDGTFLLPDGRTVIIEGGVITDVQEPFSDPNEEVEELRNALAEAKGLIVELNNQIKSNYTTNSRIVVPTKGKKIVEPTKDDYKNAMLEKRAIMKGGK